MQISRKNIIVASTVALAVLIVIVVVLVVVSRKDSPKGPEVVTRGIFKRCDGLSDPIDDIYIGSCPHNDDVGFCELEAGKNTDVTLSFTPSKWQFSCDQSLVFEQTDFT